MRSSLPCFLTFCRSGIPTSCYIFKCFLLLVVIYVSYQHNIAGTDGAPHTTHDQLHVRILSSAFSNFFSPPFLPLHRISKHCYSYRNSSRGSLQDIMKYIYYFYILLLFIGRVEAQCCWMTVRNDTILVQRSPL